MMQAGRAIRMEIFGSSHGPEVGVEVTGLPRGTPVSPFAIQQDLDRRRPVGRKLATKRQEADLLVIDRGVTDGVADGTPVRAHVANEDVRRAPYDRMRNVPRPGHADYPARIRFGPEADLSGGGIFSGRMTVGLVIAGALVRPLLDRRGIRVVAFSTSIGGVEATIDEGESVDDLAAQSSKNEARCPDARQGEKMEEAIARARRSGDSVGGIVECRAATLPVGLGEPFFDSLESVLAQLAFSIPAVKAIEFGDGIAAARRRGSENNDPFYFEGTRVRTRTNHAGGILGGLATGEPLVLRAFIKPTASIAHPQESVDLGRGLPTTLKITGRHDPCIVPRAVVVVEAIVRFGLADLLETGGFP